MASTQKAIFALVLLACITQQASATLWKDEFLVFWDKMDLASFKLILYYEVYYFLLPLIAGPVFVLLEYLWTYGKFKQTYDGKDYIFTYAEALGAIGIGNLNQLTDLMFGLMDKILAKTFADLGVLSTDQVPARTQLEKDLFLKLGITY